VVGWVCYRGRGRGRVAKTDDVAVVWVVWWVRGSPIGAVSPAGGESWLAASVPKLVGWQGQGQGRRGEGGKSRAGQGGQARRTCSRLQTGGQRRRAPLHLRAGVAATAAAEGEAMHSAHRRGVAARRRPP
jgi:hypothetical protein